MIGWLRKGESGLFASRSLTGHWVRGAAAFVLLYGAVRYQHAQPGWALAAGALAIAAMRGCPVCWAIGLFETASQRLRGKKTP